MPLWLTYDKLTASAYQGAARPAGLDDAHVETLARHIFSNIAIYPKTAGLINLPQVVNAADGEWEILDGHHRIEACRRLYLGSIPGIPSDARWVKVPCVIASPHPLARMLAALDANMHKDLSAVGRARMFAAAIEHGINRDDLMARYNLSAPALSNLLRLLVLPPQILDLIDSGVLGERHGRAMVWLAQHMPDTMQKYLNHDGFSLWWSVANGRNDADAPNAPGDSRLLTVKDIEHRIDGIVAGSTAKLNLWALDWVPDIADPLQPGACQDCPYFRKYKRDAVCTQPGEGCFSQRWNAHYYKTPNTEPANDEDVERLVSAPPTIVSGWEDRQALIAPSAPPVLLKPDEKPAVYDSAARRQYLEKKKVKEREVTLNQRRDFSEAADIERVFQDVTFLQYLCTFLKSPRGWGEVVAVEDPETLKREIARVLVGRIADNGVKPFFTQCEIIRALGGEPDEAALEDAFYQIDAAELKTIVFSQGQIMARLRNIRALGGEVWDHYPEDERQQMQRHILGEAEKDGQNALHLAKDLFSQENQND